MYQNPPVRMTLSALHAMKWVRSAKPQSKSSALGKRTSVPPTVPKTQRPTSTTSPRPASRRTCVPCRAWLPCPSSRPSPPSLTAPTTRRLCSPACFFPSPPSSPCSSCSHNTHQRQRPFLWRAEVDPSRAGRHCRDVPPPPHTGRAMHVYPLCICRARYIYITVQTHLYTYVTRMCRTIDIWDSILL